MSNEKLTTELMQLAAVATQALTGLAQPSGSREISVLRVKYEMIRQDEKWGDQRTHTPAEWFVILAEEFGEAATETAALDLDLYEHDAVFHEIIVHAQAMERLVRKWLHSHGWSERQQQVVDAEKELS